MMKKKKKMLKEVLNWKREGEGILVWPKSFLAWPTKTQYSQMGEKIVQNFLDKNAHSSLLCVYVPAFLSYFF